MTGKGSRSTLALVGSFAALALLSGCGANVKPPQEMTGYFGPQMTAEARAHEGSLLGPGGLNLGLGKHKGGNEAGGIGVNAYLWRGALDTLSFMPLASADPFGGTIITDWYSPPGVTDERFKINAFIVGRELRSDAVRVSIFRQKLEDGRWVDAPVSAVTTSDIDNRILDRARQIKAQLASE